MTTTATTFSDDFGGLRSRVEALEAELASVKQAIENKLEEKETQEGIRRGLQAVDEGHVRPAHEAFDEIRRRRNIPTA